MAFWRKDVEPHVPRSLLRHTVGEDVLTEPSDRTATRLIVPGLAKSYSSAGGVLSISPYLFVAMTLVMATSLTAHGIYGVFWCYPAVVLSYFALSTRLATVCSVALFTTAAWLVERHFGTAPALCLVISLGFTIAILAVTLHARGALQRRLAEQAIVDPLTGAFNRRHMNVCLTTAIERRNRTGESASLLLFDIDRFKEINDTLGHAAGDHVLTSLVGLVVGCARKLDVLFRIGGEEFALLLAGAGFTDALSVAEDLRSLVATAGLLEGRDVSISVGVSELREAQSVNDWVEEADAALYLAKQGGRNRVVGRPSRKTPVHLEREVRKLRIAKTLPTNHADSASAEAAGADQRWPKEIEAVGPTIS